MVADLPETENYFEKVGVVGVRFVFEFEVQEHALGLGSAGCQLGSRKLVGIRTGTCRISLARGCGT